MAQRFQINNLVRYLRKCHIMADKKKLVIPVLGYLFLAYINGTERPGQVFTTTGVEIGGWLVKKSDAGTDGLQKAQAQGDNGTHHLPARQLIVGPLPEFTIHHIPQHY